jgi:putative ABC transport system ATP-binding protein
MPATAPAPVVFQIHHLSKVYGQGEVAVTALRDVSLDIRRGEFMVLLGASGSGKSTLLNILGGLDTPTTGEVRFADHDLTRADEAGLTRYRREHVGFVFQFYNLIPSLTVRENVALVTDIVAAPMDVDEAIDRVGLSPRRDHFPAQLSGGEQQRVAIARAIVKRPDVLLCDEPTGALDYQTGKLVLEVIARINAELGTTAVVITHNAAIAGMADRVVYLGDGRIQKVVENTHKLSPRTWPGSRDEGPEPQAAARPAPDVEPGADHRAGGGQRGGRLHHHPVGGRFAGAGARCLLRPGPLRRCVRQPQARPLSLADTLRALPGVADVQTTVEADVRVQIEGRTTRSSAT